MADKIKFWPIRGTESRILEQPYYDGKFMLATDTNKIYFDANGSRHVIQGSNGSGSGSGISYANASEDELVKVSQDDSDINYTIPFSALEDPLIRPEVGSLIINSDGKFFRVTGIDTETNLVLLSLIAVSGSGSGGGGNNPVASTLTLAPNSETIAQGMTFIYGQNYYAEFVPTSTTDDYVTLSFNLADSSGTSVYSRSFTGIPSGETYSFNTNVFPVGSGMTLIVTLNSDNSGSANGVTRVISGLTIVRMGLRKSSSYVTRLAQAKSGVELVEYYLDGGISGEKLHVSVDGSELSLSNSNVTINTSAHSISVPAQSHGAHTIALWLSIEMPNGSILTSTPITYDITWVDSSTETPIIWMDEVPEIVVQYETCVVKYQVYDPNSVATSSAAEILLYKEGVEIATLNASYSATGDWLTWDLTELYEIETGSTTQVNHFSIQCGTASKEFSFTVTTEGSRDLGLAQTEALELSLSSSGRSNNEIKEKRSVWTSSTDFGSYTTTFNNFNWQNNGWKDDNDGYGAYLSVANGANAKINFRNIVMNSTVDYTIELRFRVKNIQKYSTLVSTTAYYKVEEDTNNSYTLEEVNENGYTIVLDSEGYWTIDHSDRIIKDVDGVVFKLLNSQKYGLAVGTQEAYFNTSTDTINVRYQEDEIINLSFVISATNKIAYVYLNGILSGASSLQNSGSFTLPDAFEINSDYCDVDIYKLRVYRTNLTMPEVIHNYISDIHNITLYDQNQLTQDDDPTLLSYSKMVEYNKQQVENNSYDTVTMPYATIEIIDNAPYGGAQTDDHLPYFKGNNRVCEVTFVNPALDAAYNAGLISTDKYLHSSPSYKATGVDINVQGTSSQRYPRRNFKTKMKGSTWKFTNEKFIEDYGSDEIKKWYEDNDSYATNKFTWKIDYMESSGSYNTGFANLVGSMYSKHPVQDLKLSDIDASNMRTSIYGFPVAVFHKHSTAADIAALQDDNPDNDDAVYEFIGRYNLNLDKSSNEYYGFEEKITHPYIDITPDEDGNYLFNGETLDHAPQIKDVAECWELRDNQGTWCSFSYPATAESTGFATLTSDGALEVKNHFEYRYIANDDLFEEAYDGTIGENFDNQSTINTYLRSKYANLEIVFNWLNSTDSTKATGNTLDTPVTYNINGATDGDDENTTYTYDSVTGVEITATYTTDCAGYRKQKFRNEFSKHFDEEYCSIYYVMTELLLCYDSRGKNMMLATWGPHEKGGDYIWYPIFYDIDTQLGLNNSGATLWDYDTDASKDLVFSTPNSVLWRNFEEMFKTTYVNRYEALRDGSNSKEKKTLNETTIDGAYLCDPEVYSTSYAMRGIRPIIIMGLDIYYKYIAPSITGWYTQNGSLSYTADYNYAINGDRKLSRALLVRNRLNYLDSYWRTGDYMITKAKANEFRMNANNNTTSDKYLDASLLTSAPTGYELATYPVPYYDAVAAYTITPFLNQYVFTYYDEDAGGESLKYDAAKMSSVTANVSATIDEGFRRSTGFNQQLSYIPQIDYISSLGDVSLKYFDTVTLVNGKRLLDLHIGSDAPGYYNGALSSTFSINDAAYTSAGIINPDAKTLLQSIVLNNCTNLAVSIDLTGSQKLKEFRALNTKIVNVVFADGAPLDTVHLPSTVNSIQLVENQNLTRIIDETMTQTSTQYSDLYQLPKVFKEFDSNGTAVYYDKDEYAGLYIQGLTDATSETSATAIDTIKINGGGLGYDSYRLMEKFVNIKKKTIQNDSTATAKMEFTDVKWSPYEEVDSGALYNTSTQYYRLTDHSNFVEYTYSSKDEWDNLTLNGKIFTYDGTNENTITSTELFDLFESDYQVGLGTGGINHYINCDGLETATVPNISGSVFIANADGDAIDEITITNLYNVRWPNLNFYAANVNESYVTKYVQTLSSGKDSEIEVLRSSKSSTSISMPTKNAPTMSYQDFEGWSLDNTEANIVLSYNSETRTYSETDVALPTFSESNTVITLYAIFTAHKYTITYANNDGSELATKTATFGEAIPDPQIVPINTNESSLALTRTYKFKGWTRNQSDSVVTSTRVSSALATVTSMVVTQNITVYACYVEQSVYDEPTNPDYFTYSAYTYTESAGNYPFGGQSDAYNIWTQKIDSSKDIAGVKIDIKDGVTLQGKITLPTYSPSGLPIVAMGWGDAAKGNFNHEGGVGITHIFWYNTDGKKPELRLMEGTFYGGSGYESKLQYFEFPASLRIIGANTFNKANLKYLDLNDGLIAIMSGAFFGGLKGAALDVLKIPYTVVALHETAFNYMASTSNAYPMTIRLLQFGDSEHGSQFQIIGTDEKARSFLVSDFADIYAACYSRSNAYMFGGQYSTLSQFEFYGSSQEQIDKFRAMLDYDNDDDASTANFSIAPLIRTDVTQSYIVVE